MMLAIEFFYWKAAWAGLPRVFFTNRQISDVVFSNKNHTLKFWENFRKFEANYLENGSVKFRETFSTTARCRYLLLIVPTEFLITLNVYGSTWHFLDFRHYISMAISADKFKIHCLRNSSFKTWITLRMYTYIPLLSSSCTDIRWKMFSARGCTRHAPITAIVTL